MKKLTAKPCKKCGRIPLTHYVLLHDSYITYCEPCHWDGVIPTGHTPHVSVQKWNEYNERRNNEQTNT